MNQFKESCISCLKPLNSTQTHCDECHYINIKTETLDDRLLLMYFKYLEGKGLNLYDIRQDKLDGMGNFNFDASMQFLDDKETTGAVLEHYISKNYPNLVKSESFMNIGFSDKRASVSDKNIESLQKNIFQPIIKTIKETYEKKLNVLDVEINSIRPFMFLTELFDFYFSIRKLVFTFKHISDADFRENLEVYSNTSNIEIKALDENTAYQEKLCVLKDNIFLYTLRHLAEFLYDLDLAVCSRSRCRTLSNVVSNDNNTYTTLYEYAIFNEKLVQLASYKTHFSHGEDKNFRDMLNLQVIAGILRSCEGKSKELDPWIYLTCEEVMLSTKIQLNEDTASSISKDYDLSLSLALDGSIPEKYHQMVKENEQYTKLHWLFKDNVSVEREMKIAQSKRLNIYQFEALEDIIYSLTDELKTHPNILLSKETITNLLRHYIDDDNPNKRLFKRFKNATETIQDRIIRLFFIVANDNQLINEILPLVKEPLIPGYQQGHIINLLWKRSSISISLSLLQTIDDMGNENLAKFLSAGPTRASYVPDEFQFEIENASLDYIVNSCKEERIHITVINRFIYALKAYKEKKNTLELKETYDRAITLFSTFKRFSY